MVKKAFLVMLISALTGWTQIHAQTTRITTLQNAKNLAVTTAGGESKYYLVTGNDSKVFYKRGGKIVAGNDTASIRSMRLKSMSRYTLDEDSTTYLSNYAVDHGLLALRRSFELNKWNTLVLPVSLTGYQVLDAFGEGTMLARYNAVTDEKTATIELECVNLNTDSTSLTAGTYYLIRPTREPDVAVGSKTLAIYGSTRVAGPVYVIPSVTLPKGTKIPAMQNLRSKKDEVRMRISGTYMCYDDKMKVFDDRRNLYFLDDNGLFSQHTDSVSVKAFRSWIIELKNTDSLEVRFYINGINEDLTGSTAGIYQPLTDKLSVQRERTVYDLQGRKFSKNNLRKGMYIINGRKVFVR